MVPKAVACGARTAPGQEPPVASSRVLTYVRFRPSFWRSWCDTNLWPLTHCPWGGFSVSVSWLSMEDLGALVRRHRIDDSVNKAIARATNVDLICIDLCRARDYAEAFDGGR